MGGAFGVRDVQSRRRGPITSGEFQPPGASADVEMVRDDRHPLGEKGGDQQIGGDDGSLDFEEVLHRPEIREDCLVVDLDSGGRGRRFDRGRLW